MQKINRDFIRSKCFSKIEQKKVNCTSFNFNRDLALPLAIFSMLCTIYILFSSLSNVCSTFAIIFYQVPQLRRVLSLWLRDQDSALQRRDRDQEQSPLLLPPPPPPIPIQPASSLLLSGKVSGPVCGQEEQERRSWRQAGAGAGCAGALASHLFKKTVLKPFLS